MERGSHEEEAGGPPGERVKPHKLLRQNMDSKSDSPSARAGCLLTSNTPPVFHSYPVPNAYFLFCKVVLLLFIPSLVPWLISH